MPAEISRTRLGAKGPALSVNASTSSIPAVTYGLDLGDRFSSMASLSADGTVVEQAKVPSSLEGFTARFAPLPTGRVVLEAGAQSPWVSRLLASFGHEVVVANPRRLRLITTSARKSDRVDAIALARLGRADPLLLSPINHRPAEVQAALAVIRSRLLLVRTRTAFINHCRGAAKAFGTRLPSCDARYFHRRALLALPPELRPALLPIVEQTAQVSERIAAMDRQVEEVIDGQFPDARLLQQVPGVGPITALTFVLTIADHARFRRSREVGAYLGLVPRRHQSGDRDPHLAISKEGDTYLRSLLVEVAHFTLSHRAPDSELRRWALARIERAPLERHTILVALARRMAVLLHALWESRQPYRPLQAASTSTKLPV
jgi:transposase